MGRESCVVFVSIIFATFIPASVLFHLPAPSRQLLSFYILFSGTANGYCDNCPIPGSIFIPLNQKLFSRELDQRGSRKEKGRESRESERIHCKLLETRILSTKIMMQQELISNNS